MDWTDLTQDRDILPDFVNKARDKIRDFIKCGEFHDLLGNNRRVNNSDAWC